MAGLWSLGVPERLASAKEAKRVAETAPEKLGSANGGKLKRLVVAEYEALQACIKHPTASPKPSPSPHPSPTFNPRP